MGEPSFGVSGEKEDKQLQAILYAIQCYPWINRTTLMKYIFFVDLFTYNKRDGETLLEDQYIRLPRGPVPMFGFQETSLPDEMTDFKDNGKFEIYRMRNDNHPELYSYRFVLKPGIDADLTAFKKGESDLLNLTLRSVMSRNTAWLSQLTHTYSLWKDHSDGTQIDLMKFKLERKEEDQLELFLNAKVYLTPMRKNGWLKRKFFSKGNDKENNPPLIKGFPEHLPIYFNEETGEIIE